MRDSDSVQRPSLAYAWMVVAILMVAYIFSFVDRQILNLMVGPIRRDLGISDTEMSLLMGLSFAIFYTVAGIPLGRIAEAEDGANRVGFLVSDEANFITGQAYNVNGGLLFH